MQGRDKDKVDVIETLPLVPLRGVVVCPHRRMRFAIGRPSSIKAPEYPPVTRRAASLPPLRDATPDNPAPEESLAQGPTCNIVQGLTLPHGDVNVMVEGLDRGRALEFKEEQGFFKVVVKLIPRQV